jgi:predicted Zn-dependent peptidase
VGQVYQDAFQKALGQKVKEVFTIKLKMTNGTSSVSSPFAQLKTLSSNLESALSGSSLARNTHNLSEALTRLSGLKAEGIITEEEFERAKSGFIGSSVEIAENSIGILRQLHSLLQSGVLSESEFNMKKWDILSKKI